MAKYNLIKNGIFTSTTASGTGNKSLTSIELVSLNDDNISTLGVSLTPSDVLYLDVDLGQRIKVDSIQLYASDLTKHADITFQYKNEITDTFSICSESVSETNYIATVPEPSAPRYIRCTVSGIDIDLYEFKIINDDYIVEFGSDGSETEIWIEDTPIGILGNPRAIEIFNNHIGSKATHAYVCVDYTGNGKDHYIKISSTETGDYIGIDSEAIVGYKWKDWDAGTFDNTYREIDNTVRMSSTLSPGTYTTSIISLEDQFKASYFIVDADTEVGKSSVSTDVDLFDGTIEVRSNDTAPVTINEIYWPYKYDMNEVYIGRYIVGTDSFNSSWLDGSYGGTFNNYTWPMAVDRRTGRIFLVEYRSDTSLRRLQIYDRAGTNLYNVTTQDGNYLHYSNRQPYFDNVQGIWFYDDSIDALSHHDYTLTSLGSKIVSSLFQLAAQLDSTGCWYTERNNNTLVKVTYNCTVDVTINLSDPYGVCGTEDNGCWVVDNADVTYGYTVKRYDVEGNLIKTIILDKPFYSMSHDNEDGFYIRSYHTDGEVRHYNSDGVMNMKVEGLFGVDYLSGGAEGCVAYSSSYKKTYYIDKATASVLWEKDYDEEINGDSYNQSQVPALFSYNLEMQDKYADTAGTLLPVSYDLLWYGEDNLPFQEVPKDGYFLPKHRYHQVRTTLRSQDASSTPILKSIAMAPAVKVTDISPQQSKPVYVRTDIPVGDTVSYFDTRIKVWWDIEE